MKQEDTVFINLSRMQRSSGGREIRCVAGDAADAELVDPATKIVISVVSRTNAQLLRSSADIMRIIGSRRTEF